MSDSIKITDKRHMAAHSHAGELRARMGAISGGYDFTDTAHNVYLAYGYPASLQFFNFWNMFRRFGIAARVVKFFPEQTWLDDPTVEGTDEFNRELKTLEETFGLWRRLKGLDIRQRVGRYAGMFMRVRDGLKPIEPIAGKLSGIKSLIDMIPLYENQLKVLTTQDDPLKDDFGMPTMYQFNGGATGNRNEKNANSFPIHPDRIVIASEESDNSDIYGIPALENVYNDLLDLRKTLGGGAEGFFKNAAQSIIFDVNDTAKAAANAPLLKEFNEQMDDFMVNRMQRSIISPGMTAKTLDSNLINPKDFALNSLMSVSAGSGMAVSILIGNQTGRLAGDQDTAGTLAIVQARRLDFGVEMVRGAVDWLMKWGILPFSVYEVEFEDAMAPSTEQKLTNADKMADINSKQFLSGGQHVFEGAEIRESAGFEPLEGEIDLPSEEIDEDDLNE